ncbi:unnamed protein product [Microthlaspi erraticum]|uniref:HTH three-helical bundle domain-containing protein n=1 Tax=Microthlaspi erraticum TaxID=1685480 RepID=A0A6D2KXB8_9BRAS|nr:unnamed protein product [Microthlaspi erraticum]
MIDSPSSIDREVAASLLLLSSEPLLFSSSRSGSEGKCISMRESYGQGSLSLSFASTETRSCESALSNSGSSRKSSESDFMNFKIAKKRRTNVIWSSDDMEPTHSKKNPYEFDDLSKCSSDSKEESCLSTGSSEISSTASRIKTTSHEKKKQYRESKKKETHRSSSVRRRAVKILEFLSTSCSSEVKIRQVLGDSADTSKALRMLVKMGYVKRSGAGGKHEPFVYKIA